MTDPRIDRLRRNLLTIAKHEAPIPDRGLRGASASEPIGRRGRAAVVCWSLSHNPVGRAFVLARLLEATYAVTIVGPLWSAFGGEIWPPIMGLGLSFDAFPATSLHDVLGAARRLGEVGRYDLVVICKPRLPGLALGLALAEASASPLVFDFDEDESSFVAHRTEATETIGTQPYGARAGDLAALVLTEFSDVAAFTASSRSVPVPAPAQIVRHARDETAPIPARDEARRALGLREDDFVTAFVGTVRAHKGLATVIDAVERISDPRLKLIVAGAVRDQELMTRLLRMAERGQALLPAAPAIDEIGRYLAAADLVPLMQDEAAPIAASQTPAKLTDALQHGVRAAASNSAPLREVALAGIVDIVAPERFADWVSSVVAAPRDPDVARRARALFDDEFSFAVNRARLAAAIAQATARGDAARRVVSAALERIRNAAEARNLGGTP